MSEGHYLVQTKSKLALSKKPQISDDYLTYLKPFTLNFLQYPFIKYNTRHYFHKDVTVIGWPPNVKRLKKQFPNPWQK